MTVGEHMSRSHDIRVRGLQVAIKKSGERAPIMSAVRTVTGDLDPEVPVYRVQMMTETLDDSLWTRRAASRLIAAFSTACANYIPARRAAKRDPMTVLRRR